MTTTVIYEVARYSGPGNAGKALVLDQGADLTLAGNSLSQMDFGAVQAVGTERILAACSVPGVLVGLEPLRGAGRGYQESMQKLANVWARPQWRSVCGALSQIVDVPSRPCKTAKWKEARQLWSACRPCWRPSRPGTRMSRLSRRWTAWTCPS